MDNRDIENRFRFHPANSAETQRNHEEIRSKCLALAYFLNDVLFDGREKSLAITHLEEVMFWSNAAIARRGNNAN